MKHHHRYLYRPAPANHPALKNCFLVRVAAPLPPKVDLRSFLLPPRDQGDEGCCSGFGTAALRECSRSVALAKSNAGAAVVKYLSPAYLYAKTRITEGSFPEDVGATIADEVVTLQTLGVCPESALIYSGQPGQLPTPKNDVQARPFRCGVPESVDSSDPSNLEAALSGGQTVVFGMPVYSSFEDVGADGMVPIPGLAEECLGGHCMLAVGYDHAAGLLTVRNSWGTDWGVGGHCFIPYAMISQFAEAWVIPITP